MTAADIKSTPAVDTVPASKILSVSTLYLSNFRNYVSERIEVSNAPVVLTGHNGAGKTNILEALSLLTPGRGLRKAKLSEIDAIGGDLNWTVAATVQGMQGESKIGTGRDPEGDESSDRRILKIDGKIVRGQGELSRHLSMVWLTPQMERLFDEGTSAGRKFLDRLVYSFDPDHASRINEYEYAMRERNKLLERGGYDSSWLDALEQTMAETAAAIAQARLQTMSNINHAVSISGLSFPKAHMSMRGMVEEALHEGTPAVQMEEAFKRALLGNRNQDAAAGRTLLGIHRSELKVLHVDKGMPAGSCSTGEQKAVLLSIILAQARAGAMWRGVVPIMLLDEVIAHLDSTRKLELFQEICQIGAQVWMTGTDEKLFADLQGKTQFFRVENGRIF